MCWFGCLACGVVDCGVGFACLLRVVVSCLVVVGALYGARVLLYFDCWVWVVLFVCLCVFVAANWFCGCFIWCVLIVLTLYCVVRYLVVVCCLWFAWVVDC